MARIHGLVRWLLTARVPGRTRRLVAHGRQRIRAASVSGLIACTLLATPIHVLRSPAYAQGIGGRAPSILNQRGESVSTLFAWEDAVRRHAPRSLDASAERVAAFSAEQMAALKIELATLLILMDRPERDAFTVEDQRLRRLDVLYTAGELARLRQLARSLGGRDPESREAPDVQAKSVGAARDRLLKRATVLHTDVARLAERPSTPGGPRAGTGGQQTMSFSDGRVVALIQAGDHWEFARHLLSQAKPSNTSTLLWFRATLAWMSGSMQLYGAHYQIGTDQFPDDPTVLFLRGCLHETLAGPLIQGIVDRGPMLGAGRAVRSAKTELRDAATYFQRAVTRDPAFSEARIRLGRVQSLLGEHAAAVIEVQRALSSEVDPLLRYYGYLTLGSALESMDDRDGAGDAYRRAAAQYPGAETPKLALSHLAAIGGDVGGAQMALAALTERDRGDDPWSRYYVSSGRTSDEQLRTAYELLLDGGVP